LIIFKCLFGPNPGPGLSTSAAVPGSADEEIIDKEQGGIIFA
jgi:hypothetical protein